MTKVRCCDTCTSELRKEIYPPLIFLGIGAMTDFSTMLSNPKLVLLGAAAQVGVFLTYLGALCLAFTPQEAGAIGIIGGADGPTAIFLASHLAPELLGAIAIAAYSYMALVPVIQPPIMKLLTTKEERLIRMKPSRKVSRQERIVFPDRRVPDLHDAGTRGDRADRHAVLRQFDERMHRDRSAGADGTIGDDRYCDNTARFLCRCEHQRTVFPEAPVDFDFRTRCRFVRRCHGMRRVVRQD